jgi:hypothetical protein
MDNLYINDIINCFYLYLTFLYESFIKKIIVIDRLQVDFMFNVTIDLSSFSRMDIQTSYFEMESFKLIVAHLL